MHYSLNKTLKFPIRFRNLNKFACKYRFYWLSEWVPLFKLQTDGKRYKQRLAYLQGF